MPLDLEGFWREIRPHWIVNCTGCDEETNRNAVNSKGRCVFCELYGPDHSRRISED